MQNDIHIKQFDLAEKADLLAFLREAYPEDLRRSDPEYWSWHFLDVPYASSGDVPVWIARVGGAIAGQLAAIPIDLKVGNAITRSMWILDLVVHPKFRRKGLGRELVRYATESCSIGLGINTNEQHSPALLEGLGWRRLGTLARYQRLLFPGTAVKEIAEWKMASRLVNACYAPFRAKFSRLSLSPGRTLRPVTTFDDSFSDLWRRASTQWSCAVVRGPRSLEWQFAKQPGKKFDVFGLYEGSTLMGYVVLFFRTGKPDSGPSKVAISDICYDARHSDDVIDDLLRSSLHLACQKRAGSLVVDVVDAKVEQRLRRFSFWRIKKSPQFMVKATEHQSLVYNMSNWFLTRGDSDVSIFEEPNL